MLQTAYNNALSYFDFVPIEYEFALSSSEILHKMQKLAQLIDLEIFLPSLILVGSQSAGKTSLINKFAGIELLPTSSSMTTRCPFEIILIKTEMKTDFCINEGKQIKDFDEFKCELQQEIKNQVGEGFISSSIIKIKYSAPNVLCNLTFIDLPGLIQVCQYDSNLPAQIELLISNILVKYPKSIIVACIPARLDIEVDVTLRLLEKSGNLPNALGCLLKTDLLTQSDRLLLEKQIQDKNLFPLGYGYELVDKTDLFVKKLNVLLSKTIKQQIPIMKRQIDISLHAFGGDKCEEFSIHVFIAQEYKKFNDWIDHGILGEEITNILTRLRNSIIDQAQTTNQIKFSKRNQNTGYHLEQPIYEKSIASIEKNLDLFFDVSKLSLHTIDQLISKIVNYNEGDSLDEISILFRTSLESILNNNKKEAIHFINSLIEIEQALFWTSDNDVLSKLNLDDPSQLAASYSQSIHKNILCDIIPKLLFCKFVKPLTNGSFSQMMTNALNCQPGQLAFLARANKKQQLQELLKLINLYSEL